MTTPFESRPAVPGSPLSGSTCNRSYLIAALRAAAIVVVLLTVLAALVLF